MANLDQLNFEVKINDSEFNQKCNAMMAKAQELNTSLSRLLDLTARISSYSKADEANARRANRIHASNVAAREKENREVAKTVAKQKELNALADARIAMANVKVREMETRETEKTIAAQRRLNATMSRQGALLSQLKTIALSYFGVMGTARIIGSMVRVSAEFEMQRRTLQYIIQDSYKGLKIFEQIKDLAVMSPFTFKELMTYTKQLSAFSVPKGELFETTKMLADVSAGLGVSMDRLILAYGQIRSASFLRGQEVRQLTEAGVPILEDLRRQFVEMGEEGITVGDVFDKISKRLVPFEMVAKVFKDMTSEGGKFYKMQEVQAETLQGKISNLKDAYQIMFAEIGEKGDAILKGSVDAIRSLASNWKSIGQTIVELIAAFGTFYGTIAMFRVAEYIAKVGGLMNAIRSLTIVQKALNAVMAVNPYAAIAGIVAGLGAAILHNVEAVREFNRELNKIATSRLKEATDKIDRFDKLSDALRSAARGSQDYRDAISQLNREYGEYLPNLLTEADALDQLAASYDLVTKSIKNRSKAEAEDLMKDRIKDTYEDSIDNYESILLERLAKGDMAGFTGLGLDVAGEIVRQFKAELLRQTGDYNVYDVFNAVFERITGRKEFSWWDKFWGTEDPVNNLLHQLGVSNLDTTKLSGAVLSFAEVMTQYNNEQIRATNLANERFGESNYTLEEQERRIGAINDKWEVVIKNIKGATMADADYYNALNQAELNRHRELYAEYLSLGRSDEAKREMEEIDRLAVKVAGFGEIVNNVLKDAYNIERKGAGLGQYFVTTETRRAEYIKMLRDNFADVSKAVVDAEAVYSSAQKQFEDGLISDAGLEKEKKNYETLKQEKEAIENIAKALGLVLEKEKKGSTRTVQNPRIAELKREADLLKDVMRLYDRYVELGATTENETKKILSGIYGNNFGLAAGELLDFDNILSNIITELRTLGDEGNKAADALAFSFTRIGKKDKGNEVYDSMKAYSDFQRKLRELLSKDYGVEGTDIGYKLSKIAIDVLNDATDDKTAYEKAVAELDKGKDAYIELMKSKGKDNAEAEWSTYRTEALKQLSELYEAKNKYDKKSAQETINNLGQQYVTDAYFKAFGKKNPLTDWGDKSLSQITSIKDTIKDLIDGGIQLGDRSDEINEQLENAGLNLTELWNIIKTILNSGLKEATIEEMKRIKDAVSSIANAVGKISKGFSEVAEATNDMNLKAVAEAFDVAAESISEASKIFGSIASGDTFSAFIGVVTYVFDLAMKSIAMEEKARKQVIDNTLQYAKQSFEQQLSLGVDSLFGENLQKKLQNAIGKVRELQGAVSVFNELSGKSIWVGDSSGRYGFQGIAYYSQSLQTLARQVGETLYDAEGRLRKEALIAIRDNYKILNNSESKWINDAIENIDKFNSALEQQNAVMKELVGDLADMAVSGIIDKWAEGTDAVWEYNDALNSVVDTYISMAMKSMILDRVFNKDFENELNRLTAEGALSGNYDKAIALIESGLQDIADLQDGLMSPLRELYNKYHTFDAEDTADNLSNGIKGVTEDTANLLASYLNAIRADVSFNKVQVSGLSADMKVLLGLVPQTNTLEFYLEQIRAASVNTADATASILSALRDVITTDSGEPSVRTLNS